jgi:hypothetical protein
MAPAPKPPGDSCPKKDESSGKVVLEKILVVPHTTSRKRSAENLDQKVLRTIRRTANLYCEPNRWVGVLNENQMPEYSTFNIANIQFLYLIFTEVPPAHQAA